MPKTRWVDEKEEKEEEEDDDDDEDDEDEDEDDDYETESGSVTGIPSYSIYSSVNGSSEILISGSNNKKPAGKEAKKPSQRDADDSWRQFRHRHPSDYQEPPEDSNQTIQNTDEHEPVIDVYDHGKNATIRLDIDVQIDLAEDIAELARLNRLGWFKKGVALFEDKLKNHLDSFPVVVEYADLLLQQGEYTKALSFTEHCCVLHEHAEMYAPDEYMVLRSMNAYASIFATGTLLPALEALKGMSEFMKKEKLDSLKATKIHMVELYLQISLFVENNSRTYRTYDTNDISILQFRDTMWYLSAPTPVYCLGFGRWYHLLRQEGFYWESFRFLRHVLSILKTTYFPLYGIEAILQNSRYSEIPVDYTRINPDLEHTFLTLAQISSYGDEQLILSEFAITLSIGRFIAEVSPQRYMHAAKVIWHRERSLARLIIDSYQHLSTSRPFLQWILQEQGCVPFRAQLTSQLRDNFPNSMADERSSIKVLLDHVLEVGSMQKSQGKRDIESIKTVLRCAEESGDTLLQRAALQDLILRTDNTVPSRLQSLSIFANLLDTIDLVGYIDYLVMKYTMLQDIAPDMQAVEKSKLCEEIRIFNLKYPWDTAFSLPLSEYIKDNLYLRLLTDLQRPADCFPTEQILKDLQSQLPSHLQHSRFQRPSLVFELGSGDLDTEEEAEMLWSGRHQPRTAYDRVTRQTLSHGPPERKTRGKYKRERPVGMDSRHQKSVVGHKEGRREEEERRADTSQNKKPDRDPSQPSKPLSDEPPENYIKINLGPPAAYQATISIHKPSASEAEKKIEKQNKRSTDTESRSSSRLGPNIE